MALCIELKIFYSKLFSTFLILRKYEIEIRTISQHLFQNDKTTKLNRNKIQRINDYFQNCIPYYLCCIFSIYITLEAFLVQNVVVAKSA